MKRIIDIAQKSTEEKTKFELAKERIFDQKNSLSSYRDKANKNNGI
jgi:hypothetical protein